MAVPFALIMTVLVLGFTVWRAPTPARIKVAHDALPRGVADPEPEPDPAPEPEPEPEPDPEPMRVLLTGDSLMVDSADAITAALSTADRPMIVQFVGQASRPRTLEKTDDWQRSVEAFAPDLVIEFMGYWEFAAAGLDDPPAGSDGFASAYRTDTLDPWFDHLDSLGASTIVLTPAPVVNPTVTAAIADIILVIEEDAAERPEVWFVPTTPVLAPDGYTETLPDPITGEVERVRRIDGIHLCPDGAERVTELVLDVVRRDYAIEFDESWRSGAWRTSLPVDLSVECPAP